MRNKIMIGKTVKIETIGHGNKEIDILEHEYTGVILDKYFSRPLFFGFGYSEDYYLLQADNNKVEHVKISAITSITEIKKRSKKQIHYKLSDPFE